MFFLEPSPATSFLEVSSAGVSKRPPDRRIGWIPETVHVGLKASSTPATGEPSAGKTDEVALAKSLTEQLSELEQLKESGKINEEDYRTMRQKLIDNR
jgi:hypothetical protein